MYKIDLKPHKGIQRTIFGPVEVEHNQWMIYANGLHVGYVGKDPGAPINIFAELPKSMLIQMKKCVEEHMGAPAPMAVAPSDEEVGRHLNLIEGEDEDE